MGRTKASSTLASLVPASSTRAAVSKADFACETLKEAIVSGALRPGEAVVQRRIAEQLGMSAIPVMAAMRRLVAEGLIEQRPHHPPTVATLSRAGLEEIALIRTHLEVLATRTAVPHVSAAQLSALRRKVELMDRELKAGELQKFGRLNKQFHLALYEACPYPRLVEMITNLWDQADRQGLRGMFSLELAQQSQQEHVKLLELLASGQAAAAAQLVEDHKTRFMNQYLAERTGTKDWTGE